MIIPTSKTPQSKERLCTSHCFWGKLSETYFIQNSTKREKPYLDIQSSRNRGGKLVLQQPPTTREGVVESSGCIILRVIGDYCMNLHVVMQDDQRARELETQIKIYNKGKKNDLEISRMI